jgi:hypothetical protein
MLDDDIHAGHLRFFSICGFSCNIVGLGDLNHARCYSAAASVQAIEGTSDVIRSSRHGELVRKADDFATEYNQLLAQRLDALGKRTCPAGEDWDSLFYALSEHISKLTPNPPSAAAPFAWVAASTKPNEDGHEFRVHIPNAFEQSQRAQSAICAIVVENGVRRRVAILTTFGDIKSPQGTARFSCQAGEVTPKGYTGSVRPFSRVSRGEVTEAQADGRHDRLPHRKHGILRSQQPPAA